MKPFVSILFLAAILAMAGCASRAPSSGESPVTPSEAEPPPCPPDINGQPLEGDLTVPFSQRAYLLDSGELCRPQSYPTSTIAEVSAPTIPAAANPQRGTAFYPRHIYDGH